MRMFFRTLAVFGLALASLPCLSAAPAASFDQNGFDPGMLDASVPQAQRLKRFAHVIKLAEQGQVYAMDLAGTMFWQGTAIAGSPVKTNLQQARKLLAYAAVHGDVPAMAKMGELELKAGRTQQAMIWAQLYAHYLDPTLHARQRHGRRYAYASDLMQRIMDAGGKIDDNVSKDVGNMVARYDNSIRAGILAVKQRRRSGNPRLVVQPTGNPSNDERTLNGVADFMVAFNPDGSIKQAWLLASWPTDALGKMLRPWLKYARANSVDAGAGTRYLEVPITYNSVKSRQLRATH